MATVGLPLTGAGDATAQVAVDTINGEAFQRVKLFDATEGSTVPITAKATTPGAADGAMVVRPIGSTAFNQAVVGAVGLTSGSSAVGITSGSSAVELTSAGSTRLAGRFTLENPTTSVSLSSQHTVTVGNPTTAVDLSSGGSTKVIGTVNATGTTKVDVSSGVILAAGSSANVLGSVTLSSVTTAITVGSVALLAGSSANVLGSVAISKYQAPNAAARSNVTAATVDSTLLAPNTARMGAALVNDVNADCYVGLSTVAVTTASYTVKVGPGGYYEVPFGFTGGVRGFWLSTLSSGSMRVTELTS